MQKRQKGFTLLELVVTILIMGILATIAMPSYSRLMASNKVRTVVGEFQSAIFLAQKEAIRTKQNISICPSIDGENCTGTDNFSVGWIVKEGAKVIKDYPPLDKEKIQHQLSGTFTEITFRPNGRVSSMLSVSIAHQDYDECLTLKISRGGSISTVRTTKTNSECKIQSQ